MAGPRSTTASCFLCLLYPSTITSHHSFFPSPYRHLSMLSEHAFAVSNPGICAPACGFVLSIWLDSACAVYAMPSPHGSWEDFLYVCIVLFVAIFTAEAVAKLFSFGPTVYFLEWWNRFDFVVVRHDKSPHICLAVTVRWCLWLCLWLCRLLCWWLCWYNLCALCLLRAPK